MRLLSLWLCCLSLATSAFAQQSGPGILPGSRPAGAGGATSGPIYGPVGNCTTAPPYSFSGDTNTGWGSASADTLCGVVGGASVLNISANLIEQRNGANAQMFRVYNTYTDASNYELAEVGFASNFFNVRAKAAGTGVQRALVLGGNSIYFQPDGSTNVMRLLTTGLIFPADNTYDIGASGANRPRSIYAGANIVAGGNVFVGGTSNINAPSDGLLLLRNSGGTDFSRLQFGGTTSSYPAIKRNGAGIQVRLADDSGFANISANQYTLATGVAVYSGSATPEGAVTASVGSLYLRTDGGASTTLYVKESGTGNTGWKAVTTS